MFGDTHRKVVDETYHRNLAEGFLSTYDEAKYRAHEVAEDRIAKGAPIVIVQPAGVYGPGDHSELGTVIEQVRKGRMLMIPFADMGIGLNHVDDVAAGILLAFDKGRIGESYVLAGELVTMRDLAQRTARIAGRREPKLAMPTVLMKLSAPLAPRVGPMLGLPPNLREVIRASDGVTYWASDAKARRELGFSPRSLDQGLSDTAAPLSGAQRTATPRSAGAADLRDPPVELLLTADQVRIRSQRHRQLERQQLQCDGAGDQRRRAERSSALRRARRSASPAPRPPP